MTYETVQVYSGSPITAEELLVLAEFAAPSHFVSDEHLRDAADNLAEWTDHGSATIAGALRLAMRQDVRPSVVELLRAAVMMSSNLRLAHAS
jgi:predicted nucleic acid-binding protein